MKARENSTETSASDNDEMEFTLDSTAVFSIVPIVILLICLVAIINFEHTKKCLRKIPCLADCPQLQPQEESNDMRLPDFKEAAQRRSRENRADNHKNLNYVKTKDGK